MLYTSCLLLFLNLLYFPSNHLTFQLSYLLFLQDLIYLYQLPYIVIDNADNSNDTRYDLPFIGTTEKELLEEKLPVKFSGAVYRWLDEEVPYNTENNFIILSKFEIQTK